MKRFLMISTAAAARGEMRVKAGFARRLIGVLVCAFALATAGMGQVTEAWAARYDGPGNLDDSGEALALDAAGNVYVTGSSESAENSTTEYATIKYDSNGNQLWVARYDGPGNSLDQATALAVDAAGNVYI
ncbi:MAG: hypothetical protein ACR2HJ_12735 [Fimbriimonadales bacterium]